MKTLRLVGGRPSAPSERALDDLLAAPGERDAGFKAWWAGLEQVGVMDGLTFPQLMAQHALPLWEWSEPILQRGRIGRRVHLIEALWNELWAARPDEVETRGLGREEEALTQRLCTALGILYQGPRRAPKRARGRWRLRWPSLGRRPSRARTDGRGEHDPLVLWIVPNGDDGAAWAIEVMRGAWPNLEAAGIAGRIAPVGPSRSLLDRGTQRGVLAISLTPATIVAREPSPGEVSPDVAEARAACRAVWRRVEGLASLGEVLCHRGVRFADLARSDLDRLFVDELPEAIDVWGRTTAVLADLTPSAVCILVTGSGHDAAAAHAGCSSGLPLVLAERDEGCSGRSNTPRRAVAGAGDTSRLAQMLVDLVRSSVRGSV